MTYNLYAVRVFSCRWEDSVVFYRDVVGLPITFLSQDFGWAQFDVGSASLAVERCDPSDPEAEALVGRFVGISIEVEDIQATYQLLCDRGVSFLGQPKKQPWGGVLAHFRDPDGNVVTLLGRGA